MFHPPVVMASYISVVNVVGLEAISTLSFIVGNVLEILRNPTGSPLIPCALRGSEVVQTSLFQVVKVGSESRLIKRLTTGKQYPGPADAKTAPKKIEDGAIFVVP